jgi:hypothetical protein
MPFVYRQNIPLPKPDKVAEDGAPKGGILCFRCNKRYDEKYLTCQYCRDKINEARNRRNQK